jgi:hypothetical protein
MRNNLMIATIDPRTPLFIPTKVPSAAPTGSRSARLRVYTGGLHIHRGRRTCAAAIRLEPVSMRRFEIHVPHDDGSTTFAGQGCQFESGIVALCWTESPYVITELSSTLIAFMDRALPGTVVWIDREVTLVPARRGCREPLITEKLRRSST